LIAHDNKISWIDPTKDSEPQIKDWINKNLPRFQQEYAQNLYRYDEVQSYLKSLPKRETRKSESMKALSRFTREQIDEMINGRLQYVMSRVKVLETHFVAGTSASSERTQATHRKDEFNVVAVDIALRYHEHKFYFANPEHLESSRDDPNHLQQNYVMGFIFTDEQGVTTLSIAEEWSENLNDIYENLKPDDSVKEEDMQVDNRYMAIDEAEEIEI